MKIRETTNVMGVSAASPLPSMLEARSGDGADLLVLPLQLMVSGCACPVEGVDCLSMPSWCWGGAGGLDFGNSPTPL